MKKQIKPTSEIDIDSVILEGRAAGRTLAEIGRSVGMTRQGVHTRLRALLARPRRSDDAIIETLQRTNRLLAGLIVRICAIQTTGDEYPRLVLSGLGLSTQEIAAALGTTAAVVHVAKHRARRKEQAIEMEIVQ